MKSTKQIFLIVILTAFIVPQVTFAAWWNPFTWKIFQKNSPVTEQVVQITQTTGERTDNPAESKQAPVSPSTVKVETPSPSVSIPNKTLISCNGQSYEDTCTPQGLKLYCGPDRFFCATQQQIDNLRVCNGVTYNTACAAGTEFFCPSSGTASCKYPDNVQLLIDRIDETKKREDDFRKQQEERKNSSECRQASDSLDRIREEVRSARERSERYESEYKENSKKSPSAFDTYILKSMEYSRDYDNLSSKQSLLLSDYYRICEGTAVLPPIPKTYNTTCYTNSYGLINCTTY